MPKQTEIICYHKGIPVRKSNRVVLKFSETTYKKLIDAAHESGFSIHKILYFSGRPCEKCEPMVTVYDKNGEPKKIQRGILNLPENNGINIVEQTKIKSCKKH